MVEEGRSDQNEVNQDDELNEGDNVQGLCLFLYFSRVLWCCQKLLTLDERYHSSIAIFGTTQ